MATLNKLYVKSGSSQLLLHPETEAAQVTIQSEAGTASNVNAEITALRTKVNGLLNTADALQFKGLITGSEGGLLPTTDYSAGWTYKVSVAGTYAGNACEVGDLVIAVNDYVAATASNADWSVVQANLDGAIVAKNGATFAANEVAVFDDTTGKVIKSSGFTLGKSVPSDALFTDTTYTAATGSAAGLMSAADKTKLDTIAESANNYTHPSYTAADAGLYKVTVDATGHVSAATAVVKADITGLGIPAQDTTYEAVSNSGNVNGLMTPADKAKLDNIAEQANNYTHPAVADGVAAASKSTLGLYNFTVDSTGHVASTSAVVKSDITALGIPAQDTTYSAVSASGEVNGLMTPADKAKLDGITAEANKYSHPTFTSHTTADIYKITVDSNGHVDSAVAATLDDIATGTTNVPFTATLKSKLDGVASEANKYTHPSFDNSSTSGATSFVKVNVDGSGHVIGHSAVAKSDITGLGIPAQDTTYEAATTSEAGLMSAADKTKLDGVATGAEVNQNAYQTVKVGTTDITAGGKEDTITITAGSGITLTPNASSKSFSIATSQVYTCVTSSLEEGDDGVPANLADGGLIVYIPAE